MGAACLCLTAPHAACPGCAVLHSGNQVSRVKKKSMRRKKSLQDARGDCSRTDHCTDASPYHPTQGQEKIGVGENDFKLDYSFIWGFLISFIYFSDRTQGQEKIGAGERF